MGDTFLSIGRNDRCWCGSKIKYKSCHGGISPKFPRGHPLPPDPEGSWYLDPTTLVAKSVLLESGIAGAPLYLPSEREHPRSEFVDRAAMEIAALPMHIPLLAPSKIGLQRFEVLGVFGLLDPIRVREQVRALTAQDVADLRHGVLELAKATMDTLSEFRSAREPPCVVWAEAIPAERLVGQTLLWADHYLIPDDLATSLLPEAPDLERVDAAIQSVLRLRPLIELGMVVPVLHDLAVAMAHSEVMNVTQNWLGDSSLLNWVISQILVEGPSARDVIFLSARDDIERAASFFLYGRIDPGSLDHDERTFGTRMLGPYDPGHDYEPWIQQSKRQTAAGMIQSVVREMTIAEALGGTNVTGSLFRARMMDKMGRSTPLESVLWADVPYLPEASAPVLARIAAEDEAVANLRRLTGRVFRQVESASGADQITAVAGLVDEISERTDELRATIRAGRKWDGLKAGLAGAAIGVGAMAGGALGAVAGVAGAAQVGASWAKDRAAMKRNGSFVFWLAERTLKPDRGAGKAT